MSSYYNPRAYVPGGSTRRVAQAIQTLGRRRRPVAARPVARPAAPRAATPVDPFLNRANTVVSGMFKPLFAELGTARANAERAARAAYGAHATALEGALRASGAAIPQSFDVGISQAAKVNEAVANRLAGQGASSSQSLAAQLAQISADPGQANQLAQSYQGAANADFAKGSADLQHLIGRRAEAAAYQEKLPSIGRLAANRDLANALSEQRSYFGEQESALRQSAADRSYDLYGQFRDEDFTSRSNAAQIRQQTLDRQLEERMSLRALREAAITEADKRKYERQEAALERQHERELAVISANTSLATDNPPKPDKVTGPANQQWITVNGKKVKNPNYVKPNNEKNKGAKNTNDTWLTPGSSKRDRVVQTAWRAVVGPDGGWNEAVRRRLQQFPNSPDAIINTAINQAIRSMGIDPNHQSAKAIRTSIRQRLSGRTYANGEYTFRSG